MFLKNPFSEYLQGWWLQFHPWCALCKRNAPRVTLHHIYGRESSSPYNAIALCETCHGNVTNSIGERQKFMHYSIIFYDESGYEEMRPAKKEDKEFIKNHLITSYEKN